jgi:hypothetical protein
MTSSPCCSLSALCHDENFNHVSPPPPPPSLTLNFTMKGKEKVAKVIPNAILITTDNEKHFLTSFTSRDKTYLMLFRVWQNALMDKPMNPQELWQWVKSKFALLSLL